jgi:transcriptional regulator with XRE-family HTH domain
MATQDMGPVGERVARNVARRRGERDLSLSELSAKLAGLGRPILPSGLNRVESGKRRVDADDLVALCLALELPLAQLLLGGQADGEPIPLAPGYSLDRAEAWRWATRIASDAGETELGDLERHEDTLSELGVGHAAVAALEAGVPADVLVGYVYLAPTMRRMQRAAGRTSEGGGDGQHPEAS